MSMIVSFSWLIQQHNVLDGDPGQDLTLLVDQKQGAEIQISLGHCASILHQMQICIQSGTHHQHMTLLILIKHQNFTQPHSDGSVFSLTDPGGVVHVCIYINNHMRYTEFLLEYDRSREQNRIEAVGAYQTRQKQDPGFSLEKLESADPTAQKIYVPRLATWWLAGQPVADLISTTADALALYHQLKIKKLIGSEHTDLGRFGTADQFTEFMASQDAKFRGKYTKIFKDSKLEVVQLLDKTAAQWWGQGTKWCTKGQDNNQFDYYAAKGPLYVIVDRVNNTRYQLWWNNTDAYRFQFMDVKNNKFNPVQLPFYHQLQPIFAPLHPHLMWQTLLSPAEQLAAVEQDGDAIRLIPNPSLQVQLAAVGQNGAAIEHIPNPILRVQLAAVGQNGFAIQWIPNPSLAVQLKAVGQNGRAIRHIPKPDPEVQERAVEQDGEAIRWIPKPSPEVQMAAVGQNGNAIYHIKDPSLKVKLAAVQQDGWAIEWIEDPEPEVQKAAVEQNPKSIQQIRNPTPAAQALARQLKKNK